MNADKNSFEETALNYIDLVYRVAVGLCGKSNVADDLVQETFLKAFERFDKFKKGTNCKSWLLTILRNTWIDRLRHEKVAGNVVSLENVNIVDQSDTVEEAGISQDDLLEKFSDEQVIKALKHLPEEQRITLLLIDVEQMAQKEVADVTGVAVGTVKSRASRGRAELKKILEFYAKEMGMTGGEK